VRVARTIADLKRSMAQLRSAGERVGLVPTMGALHAGHMALVAAARGSCERVAATIFINPKQFGPGEDLEAYPRPETADLDQLRTAGVDLAYLPAAAEMYPARFSTLVRVAGLSEGLCGAHRPGHFDGVATVVTKLLIQTLPDFAFFGEKDYQQLLVVRRLARDLDIPVEIVGVPTVRERDGLAMSSRNAYLTPAQRRVAPELARALHNLAAAVAADGGALDREIRRARDELTRVGFQVEYLEIRDAETLAPVRDPGAGECRVFAAAYLGRTRLIDNIPIGR
jgi:pantoate--beta-alanine ligase